MIPTCGEQLIDGTCATCRELRHIDECQDVQVLSVEESDAIRMALNGPISQNMGHPARPLGDMSFEELCGEPSDQG